MNFRFLEDPGKQFSALVEKHTNRVALARFDGARKVSAQIEKLGAQNITGAGNFGTRWTQSWTAALTPDKLAQLADRIVIETFFDGSKFQGKRGTNYAHIFEFGGVIKAKNPSGLLWIPLRGANIPQGQRGSVWPSEWPDGKLFRITSKKGTPLLLSVSDHKPKFFGIAQVTEPKKFNLRGVGRTVAAQYADFYAQAMKAIR